MNFSEFKKLAHAYLKSNASFAVVGIAGGAKSSLLEDLYAYGYTKPILYAPFNKLVNRHEERFVAKLKAQGVELEVATYASGFEQPSFKAHGYKAQPKSFSADADIVIFDEVFAVDKRLMLRAIKGVVDAGLPYILLGDPYQSAREDKSTPYSLRDVVVPKIEVTECKRGTEANKKMIEALYAVAKHGYKQMDWQLLAELAHYSGCGVHETLPDDTGLNVIAYTANAISDYYIYTSGACYQKEFSGKVEYTASGELAKAWREAPVVSQSTKNQLHAFSKEVIAVPKTHMSHITCLGVEIDPSTDMHIIINHTDPYNAKNIYTLASRHVDPTRLHFHFIGELPVKTPYKKHSKLNHKNVCKDLKWPKATLSELGLSEDLAGSTIYLKPGAYTELEGKVKKPYHKNTGRIYLDQHTAIYSHELGQGKLPTKASEVEPEPKNEVVGEDYSSKVEQVLGELAAMCPAMLCDPVDLIVCNGMLLENSLAPVPLPNKAPNITDFEAQLASATDYDSLERFMHTQVPTVHSLDLAASYWQILAHNGGAIGGGLVLPYNEDAPISYYSACIGGITKVTSNFVIEGYLATGVDIAEIVPLFSRSEVLTITDAMRQHIYTRRHIDYHKTQLTVFGNFERSRFKPVDLITPSYTTEDGTEVPRAKTEEYLDEGEKACLYSVLNDLHHLQGLIMYSIAVEQDSVLSYNADCIQSHNPIKVPELPVGLKVGDFTHTVDRGGVVTSERDYGLGIHILRRKLKEVQDGRKDARNAAKKSKLEEDLAYVIASWEAGKNPNFKLLSAHARHEGRIERSKAKSKEAKATLKETKIKACAEEVEHAPAIGHIDTKNFIEKFASK